LNDGSATPSPAPGLDQFDRLFDQVIAPALAPYEAERGQVVGRFWRFVMTGGVGGLLLATGMAVISRDIDLEGLFFTVVFVTVAAAGLGYMPVHGFQLRCKDRALGDLARTLDMTYQRTDFEPPAIDRFKALRLIDPDYEDSTFEDLFTGERQGARFQLYEARLTRGSGKNRHTVFAGQLMRIAFPKRFLGVTIVQRDIQRWFKPAGFQRIGLEWSRFEKLFEVFGTDQVEARFLVHPVFMERLMAVETAMAGKSLRCAFEGGDLLVAVEGGDLFEIVDVFKPLPDRAATEKGVAELRAVLGLIDTILAPPSNVWAETGKA
jgi:hypothetical protein